MTGVTSKLTYVGAGLLALTALFHGYAFLSAAQVANSEQAHPFTAYFLEPIWLAPSVTWLGLAVMACMKPAYKVALIVAAIPILQAMIMFIFMGPFPGAIAVGLSGLLLLFGALAQRRNMTA